MPECRWLFTSHLIPGIPTSGAKAYRTSPCNVTQTCVVLKGRAPSGQNSRCTCTLHPIESPSAATFFCRSNFIDTSAIIRTKYCDSDSTVLATLHAKHIHIVLKIKSCLSSACAVLSMQLQSTNVDDEHTDFIRLRHARPTLRRIQKKCLQEPGDASSWVDKPIQEANDCSQNDTHNAREKQKSCIASRKSTASDPRLQSP